MKQIKVSLFNYNELSDEAQVKALNEHNESDDFMLLDDGLKEYLIRLLDERGIEGEAKLYYSLSYSQGDGVCFEGNFEYKGVKFCVTHDGNYYHSQSVNIEAEVDEDDTDELRSDLIDLIELDFRATYTEICDAVENSGYAEIEHEQSEDNFKELCEANEYTFEQNGEMRNF